MKYKSCLVHWRDAASKDEWTQDIIKIPVIVSQGFLISKTETEIVLAGDVDESTDTYSRQIGIPLAMVESIELLKSATKKKKTDAGEVN